MTTDDIIDLTPEDAFGLDAEQRARADARHQEIVSNFQRLLDNHITRGQFVRRAAYYYLSTAISPQQLEDDGFVVVVDVGGYSDGQRFMPCWRRPRMLSPGAAAEEAATCAGDITDGDGRFAVERQIIRPTQLAGGSEWLELWMRMQDLVLVDQAVQQTAISMASA